MQAVVYDRALEPEVREVPEPEAGPGEVKIKVTQAGFCGTDLHLHHGGFGARFPLIPGHEGVGVVTALGDGVTGFEVGQQVVVNPNAYCGLCAYCRAGDLVRCENLLAVGVNRDGMFAEYVSVPAGQVFVADGLEPDTAVLTEPASCAMHGLERLRPRPGTSALVFGAGPTGTLLAQLMASGGVAHVTVADPAQAKLDTVRALGIDQTIAIGRVTEDSAQQVTDQLRAASPTGDGYDIVVEATGSSVVGDLGLPLLRNGGTLLVYGVAREEARLALAPYEIFRRELTVLGSFAEMTSFAAAINALRSGRVRTDGLITHRFALADYAQAIEAAQHDASAHKIVIVP
ncbi:zinc-dependent alcohol dehydrogenase family protein [Microlunatus antarcticus]|uniref:D-arabinitol dehydrogenase (NADP+) n=1 Tax=Microlunatus antarcticus TaxID=53388 RepID=A0A7W5P7S7_9ACTN|nr:zinc-dependent alcohol dehydrogenase family protein [Microlunatus antarcticus]MBB3327874.1 D-arabinitol dehydrogenase (NADP+) [Microlunatus antarcticus]